MIEIQINNLSDFIQIICELDGKLIHNKKGTNESLLFRGQSSSEYELIPSIGRNRMFSADISILDEERNLIELAKYRMPEIFHRDLQPLELLALLQHHGIPTRLLDVTENALVALYFACCSDNDKRGEVFAFKNSETDIATYPVINAIADSYRFVHTTFYSLSNFYSAVISQPYFLEQKALLCHKSPECGGQWIKECCEQLLFVYSPTRHLRQQMQQGRYILFPNRIAPDDNSKVFYFHKVIDSIPKDHKQICGRIIIPHELKERIIHELRSFGVSKEILFADNIDIVCEEITNNFKRKI